MKRMQWLVLVMAALVMLVVAACGGQAAAPAQQAAPTAAAAVKAAEPELARAAQKGVVHARAASRKVSRLTARVKAMS